MTFEKYLKFTDDLRDKKNHYKLRWESSDVEGRDFELEDVDVPHGHVLVGVKLEGVRYEFGRLRLVALSKIFDFTSGEISDKKEKSYWNTGEPSK